MNNNESRLEHCHFCDSPTGKAGEGGIYLLDNQIGPLCEDCLQAIESEVRGNSEDEIARMQQQIDDLWEKLKGASEELDDLYEVM